MTLIQPRAALPTRLAVQCLAHSACISSMDAQQLGSQQIDVQQLDARPWLQYWERGLVRMHGGSVCAGVWYGFTGAGRSRVKRQDELSTVFAIVGDLHG